jgi:hypothetical protein
MEAVGSDGDNGAAESELAFENAMAAQLISLFK